jgi:hypothetical protein
LKPVACSGVAVATIGGGGKGRVSACQWELPAMAELPWQPEEEEEEGGWSRKSLIALAAHWPNIPDSLV